MSTYKNTEAMPYERFLKFGAGSLTDAELLAIILRTGTKDKNATELADEILQLQGNMQGKLIGLHQVSLEELQAIPGIGEVKAVKVKAIGELATRMAKQSVRVDKKFDSPDKIAEYYMESLRHFTTESVLLVMLDNKGHLLGERTISKGTVNASLLSPREIFIQALKFDASSIILIHNHPSGDPSPSRQDRVITRQIYESGKLMNIPLIDHIIIGDHTYSSFKELGLL